MMLGDDRLNQLTAVSLERERVPTSSASMWLLYAATSAARIAASRRSMLSFATRPPLPAAPTPARRDSHAARADVARQRATEPARDPRALGGPAPNYAACAR